MFRRKLFEYQVLVLLFLLFFSGIGFSESTDDKYVIGPEDTLNISVWENPELSRVVQVRPDGKISLPLLDEVQAEGLKPLQLKKVLTKRFESYIQNPKVTVIVSGIRNFTVYLQRGISGGGARQQQQQGRGNFGGAYVFRKKATVWDLLTRAGPISPTNDLRKAFILRGSVKLPVDLYLLWIKKDLSQNVELKPNDTLVIPNNYANRISVMGEVNRPQMLPYREGMKIMDAIVQSGGFSEDADDKRVIVIRTVAGEKVHLKVNVMSVTEGGEPVLNLNSGTNKNIDLLPGDTIVVRDWFYSMYRCLFFSY